MSLCAKIFLSLCAQINLPFRSLIRTFTTKRSFRYSRSLRKAQINLPFRSLIRTFADRNRWGSDVASVSDKEDTKENIYHRL